LKKSLYQNSKSEIKSQLKNTMQLIEEKGKPIINQEYSFIRKLKFYN